MRSTLSTLTSVLLFVFAATSNVSAGTQTPDKRATFGFAFHYQYDKSPMVLGVCAIRPGSPAETAGLQPDDKIVAVDEHTDFRNSLEVLEYLFSKSPGDILQLKVVRDQKPVVLSLVAREASEEEAAAIRESLKHAKEEAEQHQR